jgi:hypothetical protein
VQSLFYRYLNGIVGAHREDKRIFAWDLANEPLMGAYIHDAASPVRAAELRWLTWCYQVCKKVGAQQPLTIGNYPEVAALELTEPDQRHRQFHPYWVWTGTTAESHLHTPEAFEAFLDRCLSGADQAGKELFASETVWGGCDDAQVARCSRPAS